MMGSAMPLPSWPSGPTLRQHFRDHGKKLGCASVQEYADSSTETVTIGISFTYTDDTTGRQRIGYYHRASNRFTAVTGDGRRILTHYPPDRGERYVEELTDSTYR
jgi:pyocin large subunit-like protein